nr:hypothetical protein Iba_chr09cCG11220 [Ipomoea batatas]
MQAMGFKKLAGGFPRLCPSEEALRELGKIFISNFGGLAGGGGFFRAADDYACSRIGSPQAMGDAIPDGTMPRLSGPLGPPSPEGLWGWAVTAGVSMPLGARGRSFGCEYNEGHARVVGECEAAFYTRGLCERRGGLFLRAAKDAKGPLYGKLVAVSLLSTQGGSFPEIFLSVILPLPHAPIPYYPAGWFS